MRQSPRGVIGRLLLARPSLRALWPGALLWSVLLGANALAGLWLRGWSGMLSAKVAALFMIGGLLAFPLGVWAGSALTLGRRSEVRFAGYCLCLAAATAGVTAALYAVQYRLYYAQWHAPAFTAEWAVQFFFTTAVALYQFAVLGVRLMAPLGLGALFIVSLCLARTRSERSR